jgi:riboflavin biosynthesis pyrimidine reductase
VRLIFDRDQSAGRALDDATLVELYRYPALEDRAWLRSNFVTSLDGAISGTDGRAGSLNTESDQQVFALHRALADAVVVGAGTARQEGYRAVDLATWQRDLRAAEGLAPFPTLVIISASAEIDPEVGSAADGDGGPVMVITTPGKGAEELRPLRDAGIEVVVSETGELDLATIIDQLAGAGLARLLCEGGPTLHGRLLAAGLVDEMSLTLAPVVQGGPGTRTTGGVPMDPAGFALRFALFADDGTLFTSYRRNR